MTRDEITSLARYNGLDLLCASDNLLAFAALVAQNEREACAKVCEARDLGHGNREDAEARRCAKAIRARSDT